MHAGYLLSDQPTTVPTAARLDDMQLSAINCTMYASVCTMASEPGCHSSGSVREAEASSLGTACCRALLRLTLGYLCLWHSPMVMRRNVTTLREIIDETESFACSPCHPQNGHARRSGIRRGEPSLERVRCSKLWSGYAFALSARLMSRSAPLCHIDVLSRCCTKSVSRPARPRLLVSAPRKRYPAHF